MQAAQTPIAEAGDAQMYLKALAGDIKDFLFGLTFDSCCVLMARPLKKRLGAILLKQNFEPLQFG